MGVYDLSWVSSAAYSIAELPRRVAPSTACRLVAAKKRFENSLNACIFCPPSSASQLDNSLAVSRR